MINDKDRGVLMKPFMDFFNGKSMDIDKMMKSANKINTEKIKQYDRLKEILVKSGKINKV